MLVNHTKLHLLKIVWLLFDGIFFFTGKWLDGREGYGDSWIASTLFFLPCVAAILYFLIFPKLLEVPTKACALFITLIPLRFVSQIMGDQICYVTDFTCFSSILVAAFTLPAAAFTFVFILCYFSIPFAIAQSGKWGYALLKKSSQP